MRIKSLSYIIRTRDLSPSIPAHSSRIRNIYIYIYIIFSAYVRPHCLHLTFPVMKNLTVIPSSEARKNLMNLAQRMIRTFSVNISTSSGQSWTALSESSDDTVRITTRKITEPGQPNGVILSAVSTTWLPHPHYHVFDLLRDERRRSQVSIRT